jgi:desulfoferrodoxin (superoxide reductase-like protein)
MINKMFRASMMIGGLILLFLAISLYPQELYANPPQDLKIAYDYDSQLLTVTITHKSPSKGFHYIKYVEIKKNDTVISKNAYDSQPEPETFTYTYKLPAAEGNTLEVTATCNLWGHKTTTLTVAQKKQ